MVRVHAVCSTGARLALHEAALASPLATFTLQHCTVHLCRIIYGAGYVFSILNNTFGDDQDRALADYIELALQLQFNERSRSQEAV